MHFFEYLDRCGIEYKFVEWTQADHSTFYPISVSYFDFGVDWFSLMPAMIIQKLRSKSLTVWFFYSEGDNPQKIRDHLDAQCRQHKINPKMIRFTSANSVANDIPRFSHFVDDECLYQLRNTYHPLDYHDRQRSKKFTALVRTHKWWRASTMARLWNAGIHKESFFSYTKNISVDDREEDNPIEVDSFGNLRSITHDFLARCPFSADDLDSDDHNLYAITVEKHFSDSYVNIVIETHMDVDQSGGVFLTEKTFKPIKHCQPFMIVGAAGSIRQLREMGYRTFDHVIDHGYDDILNTTERWNAVCLEIERLASVDLHSIHQSCRSDLLWNQELFMAPKSDRLSILIDKIKKS